MTPEQYETYKKHTFVDRPTMIYAAHLGYEDRTLAYGYTTERDSWHAYMYNQEIHVIVYDHNDKMLFHEYGSELNVDILRPNKRVYPDTVDFSFAYQMFHADNPLPFLGNFDWTKPDVVRRMSMGPYKGKVHFNNHLANVPSGYVWSA